jgi:hypothetical protein
LQLPCTQIALPFRKTIDLIESTSHVFDSEARSVSVRFSSSGLFGHAVLDDGSIYLRWPGFLECLIPADGSRIVSRPLARDTADEAYQTYLLGQALSFALLRMGIEPLHATVVEWDGAGIALVGDSGYGKSSLAAAFLRDGARLVTDDLLITEPCSSGLNALPGPMRIKLLPETARALLGSRCTGVPMNRLTNKLVIPLNVEECCPSPVPLRAIYVLKRPLKSTAARRIRIRTLSPKQAFLYVTKNTFNAIITDTSRLRNLFAKAAEVATHVPVKLLWYPRTFDYLAKVRSAIVADLG